MLNTILFDLDGTLLPMSQDAFIEDYFKRLMHKFVALGLDSGKSVKAVWAGTKAMLENDGTMSNAARFWSVFSSAYGGLEDRLAEIEAETDRFYVDEFDEVKRVVTQTELSAKIISGLKDKEYTVVLATNPLFPPQAVATRLSWIGLKLEDFALHTDYLNSKYCKPNPGYYRDIFTALSVEPQQCIMVGNTVIEDMCAGQLGCETYLVTDCLENPNGDDYSIYRQGSLKEFAFWAESLPRV